jgi:4-hydroxybenzoate polyprenyltransferase
LTELAAVGVVVLVAQLGVTLLLGWQLLVYLMAAWLLLYLMSQEFFAGKWLRNHPIPYMLSHMFILPLIDFYLLAAAWQGHGAPPLAFGWFLVATYTNGIVFEIGRKVRAAADEEKGVETYSALWGVARATLAWLLAVTIAAAAGIVAGWTVREGAATGIAITVAMMVGWLVAGVVAWRMIKTPVSGNSRWIERISAVWVLLFYLAMGLLPHLT